MVGLVIFVSSAGNCSSEDLQGGSVFSVVVELYDDLHILIEGDEEATEGAPRKTGGSRCLYDDERRASLGRTAEGGCPHMRFSGN